MKKKMKVSVVEVDNFDICLIGVELEVQRKKDKELEIEYIELVFTDSEEGLKFSATMTMPEAKKLVNALQEIIQSSEQKRGKVE